MLAHSIFSSQQQKIGKCTAIASEVQGFSNHQASFLNLWKSMFVTIPGACVVSAVASSCPAGWGVGVVASDPDSMAPDSVVLMQSKEGQHSPSMEKGVHFMSEGGGGHSVGHSTAEII